MIVNACSRLVYILLLILFVVESIAVFIATRVTSKLYCYLILLIKKDDELSKVNSALQCNPSQTRTQIQRGQKLTSNLIPIVIYLYNF